MERISRLFPWLEKKAGDYDGLLFDIDGTLVRGDKSLHGAEELLSWLDSISCPYLLVTNDSSHSHCEKAAILRASGLHVEPEDILSAGDVIVELARERDLVGKTFFVMGELGEPNYAREAGIIVTRSLSTLPECTGVIVGEKNYDWQSTFNAVVNFFIANPLAQFIVPNPDVYWPVGDGKIAIGSGATAGFLGSVLAEYGVSVQAECLGKPHGGIFEYARHLIAKRLGKSVDSADRIIMVGDSLKGDVRGANKARFVSVLVLTGITLEEQLERAMADPELLPDVLAKTL